ncbi:MAG TPA: 16S rRNA methyltransferase [Candidatus Limnocylindria bacterium]|nr:16S rRNA methyltransferase [Candidatus Limnocylindria bacterium]
MSDDVELVVERVATSRRYRDVDAGLVRRVAREELLRARTRDEAVKRVKRRLHQAVGAFARGAPRAAALRDAWHGDLADPAFRAACVAALRTHASTAERIPYLPTFYRAIWELTGTPSALLDLGCGLGPLALPWMDLAADATLIAVDVDGDALAAVDTFLDLVGQPHRTMERDLVSVAADEEADVALLLKLVTTLDRQDPDAATRLVRGLRVDHAAVSFTRRSLGGRSRGMERTYRERMDRLASSVGAVEVREASVPNELVFVLTLARG